MKRKIAIVLAVLMVMTTAVAMGDIEIKGNMIFDGEKKELSLDEAVEIAKENSLAGKTADWNEDITEAVVKESSNNANNADLAIKYNPGFDTPVTSKDVQLAETLRDYADKQKQKNYDAEMMALEMAVKKLYFQNIQASEMKAIQEENLKIKEKLYQDTQKKFELGMVAKQELLTAEYGYLDAKTQLESAQNAEKTAKMGLNIYLGFDIMDNVELTDELKKSDFQEVDLTESISQALLNRNEIGGSKFNLDIQEINIEKIRVRYSARSSIYIREKVAYEKAQFNFENAAKSVEMDVRSKYMNLLQTQHAIEAGQKAVENATEALRLSQLTYDAGMIILTDLQNVQNMVLQAKLGLSSAILDYNIALDEFNAAISVGTTTIPIS